MNCSCIIIVINNYIYIINYYKNIDIFEVIIQILNVVRYNLHCSRGAGWRGQGPGLGGLAAVREHFAIQRKIITSSLHNIGNIIIIIILS